MTGKIPKLAPFSCMILLIPKELRNFLVAVCGKNGKQRRRSRDCSIKPSGR